MGFWAVTVDPLRLVAASADWVETPCEITSSEVLAVRGSKGTNYRVAVSYRYDWPPAGRPVADADIGLDLNERRTFESHRYDFADNASSFGVERMRATVEALPPGLRTVCFVDPADPASAVLTREVPGSVWLGCVMLLFPAFGLGLVVVAWRARAKRGAAPALAATSANATGNAPVGETALAPATGRAGRFVAFFAMALFWNGLVALFLGEAVGGGESGAVSWVLLVFLVPFALVGLVLAGLALHAFSGLFAPAVELRLDPSRLRLGQRVPFTWRLRGRGVRKLTIRAVAREEASFRRGKNLVTEKSDFFRATLFESTDALGLTEGRADLALPASDLAAPAFAGVRNKLVWELVVEGDIPWRADVEERFPLPVLGPATPPPAASATEPVARSGAGLTLWSIDRFAPGETLVCTLTRDAAAPSASAGPLTARLGWFTEGRGEAEAGVLWSESLAPLAPGGERGLEIRLPEAPWSVKGKLVSIAWRLEILDTKNTPLVALLLTLAPGASPVALPALPEEPAPIARRKADRAHPAS